MANSSTDPISLLREVREIRFGTFSSENAADVAKWQSLRGRIDALLALPPAAPERDALEYFTEYFVQNYPGPNTIISNPRWHAPKIFRAAVWALSQAKKDAAT